MKFNLLITVTIFWLLLSPHANFGQAPNLGTASSFSLFTAAGAFNNLGVTLIEGDIGTNVGAFSGFPPGVVIGQIHIADAVSALAAIDVGIAYDDLAGRTCGAVIGTTLGNGQILTPNTYCTGAASTLNGNLVLDGQGDPNAIFIIQIDGAFSTSTFASVTLINSASLCNVYWQVNGAFFLGDFSVFYGTLIADGAISLSMGATLYGQALSTAGAIETSANVASLNGCGSGALPVIACPVSATVSCTDQVPAPDITAVTVTNTCGTPATVLFLGDVITNQNCANQYLITRTYQATNVCGETVTCAQLITVDDQTPPNITSCAANVVVVCGGDVPQPDPAAITATDNCSGAVTVTFVNDVIVPGNCVNQFAVTRTYEAADVCGNTIQCVQSITVNDQSAPTVFCPANVTASCDGPLPAIDPAGVIATDNCGGNVTVTFEGDVTSAGACLNQYIVTRTYEAADVCGNTAICNQTITVSDQTAPTISCPTNVLVSCTSEVPAPNPAGIITSDNCGGTVTVTFVNDVISGLICPGQYIITRTYQAADVCGNTAICNQTITVSDQTAPTISCPANVLVSCTSEVPAPNPAGIITSDNCGGTVTVTFVNDVISGLICPGQYIISRTYQAADVCGNTAVCVQIITVSDNIAPVFNTFPANITVECSAPPVSTPTATDNCSTVTVTLSQTQIPGVCPVLSTITRIWTATDLCGNSSTISQIATVVDTEAPQFIIGLISGSLNVLLECDLVNDADTYQNWLNTHGGATVSDCSNVTWTYTNSPVIVHPIACGNTFQQFIRFIATDACGNSSYRDAIFTIMDVSPPVFDVLPQNLVVDCLQPTDSTGETEMWVWMNNFGYAEVSDNCGTVTTHMVVLSDVAGCGNTHTTTFQFQATDECGNTTFVTATFTVVDHTPPVIVTCPPSNMLLSCVGDIPAFDIAGLIVYDDCGDVTVTVTGANTGSGCIGSPMVTEYTYTATDACGNTAVCFQYLQVTDTFPIIYNGPDSIYVICKDDIPGIHEIIGYLTPLATDNCFGFICLGMISVQEDSNSVTYTMTAKDICGNHTDPFTVTFIANGVCKQFCTAPVESWGEPAGIINGMSTTTAIDSFMNQFGGVSVGKLNKMYSVTSSDCIHNMLPGNGNSAQFRLGQHLFGAANGCLLSSPLLNSDGSLKNELAANTIAMQFNIWYNEDFNSRNLGLQQISALPACLVDSIILEKIGMDFPNIQDLLNLSNDYLAGVGFFPPKFGNLLNTALDNLNNYWLNCQSNDPCSTQMRYEALVATPLSNISMAPNPAADLVTFTLESAVDADLLVRFFGSTGVQYERILYVVKGVNILPCTVATLPSGIYTVVLQYADTRETLRMVKVAD